MAMEFNLPSLQEREPGQAIREINKYLFQTVQQLNIVLGQLEQKIEKTGKDTETAAKKAAKEAVKPPRSTFDQIKGLVGQMIGDKIRTKKLMLGDYTISVGEDGHLTIM